VKECKLDIETVLNAKEAFCTGTGASVTPVGTITYGDRKVEYKDGKVFVSCALSGLISDFPLVF
jgi:branched-subunit amino acid aminotransferase/4-amino-4-deoxychorismate lyase